MLKLACIKVKAEVQLLRMFKQNVEFSYCIAIWSSGAVWNGIKGTSLILL